MGVSLPRRWNLSQFASFISAFYLNHFRILYTMQATPNNKVSHLFYYFAIVSKKNV